MRFVAYTVVVAGVLTGCPGSSKDGDTSVPTGPVTGTAGGTPGGTAGGTVGGTAGGTGGGNTSGPPQPVLSNCESHAQQKETSAVGAPTRRNLWNTFDADGYVVRQEQDLNGNGTPESIYNWTRDANGNMLDEYIDTDANGTANYHGIFTWTANGNWATFEVDYDNNGVVDDSYAYTEDAQGRWVLQEGDIGDDGTVDNTYAWIYDPVSGDLTRTEYDTNMDGVPEQVTVYTYPGLVGGDYRYAYDANNDGTPETIGETAFDAEDRVIFDWRDDGANGIVDSDSTFSYWPSGLPIGMFATFWTVDLVPVNGGYFDYMVEYEYDALGYTTQVQELADVNQDGAPGGPLDVLYTETFTWTNCSP